jgi:hypothetical protein
LDVVAAGVDRVLALVQDEFVIIMRQAGTLDIRHQREIPHACNAAGARARDRVGGKYDLAD